MAVLTLYASSHTPVTSWLKWMLTVFIINAFAIALSCTANAQAFNAPNILTNKQVQKANYLPDFSYAGYHHGEKQPDTSHHRIVDVTEHGIVANDDLDDSKALIKLLDNLRNEESPTIIQFGSGRYIISSIIYFDRNNLVVRGSGSGASGTEFYFPRPLIYVPKAPELIELNEYLVALDKVQREKKNNIHISFTEWAWSGGYFWTRVKDERVKKYLDKYDAPTPTLAIPRKGRQGGKTFTVDDVSQLTVGDIVELQWFNGTGDASDQILKDLYAEKVDNIGSHHWKYDNLTIARQQSEIVNIVGKTVHFRSPLLHDITEKHTVNLAPWKHLSEIGFEHFRMKFAFSERIAHHVEQGFNGIYLTRLYNGWINDVHITNADSGVLLEEVANLSIKDIVTDGAKYAHYSVQMGGVHNVMAENVHVKNRVEHPLSFNTFATKSVYVNARVEQRPFLDQHGGANQQNLFDNIKVNVSLNNDRTYKLFAGGGAKYWKPSHGAYNSFWNIQVHFENGHNITGPILLNGMKDGPLARVIGISGNLPLKIEYGPDAYVEGENIYYRSIPSLYYYQLVKRLKASKHSL